MWLKSSWSSALAVPGPTHSAGIALAVAVFRRWARCPRLVEDKAGVSMMQLILRCRRCNLRTCLWQPGFCACRGKTARVINYEEFKKALEELAPKRFKDKSKEEAYEAICQLVAGKEPINVGVTVSEKPLGAGGLVGRGGRSSACSRAETLSGGPHGPGWAGDCTGPVGTSGSSVGVRSLRGARDEWDGACS